MDFTETPYLVFSPVSESPYEEEYDDVLPPVV